MTRLSDFDQFTEWLDNLPENPKLMEKIELMADFYKDFDLYYNRFGEKLIQNVYKREPPDMFSAIYAINKIIVSIGQPYISTLSEFIVEAFVNVVKNVMDPEIINKLVEIRKGWSELFPEDILSNLDYELFKIDSLWPGICNDYLQRSPKAHYKHPLNAKRKARTEKQQNQIGIHSLSKSKNEIICPINMKSLKQKTLCESNTMISLQNQFKSSSVQMSSLSIDISQNVYSVHPTQEPFQNAQNMVNPLYSQNNQCQSYLKQKSPLDVFMEHPSIRIPLDMHLNFNEKIHQNIPINYNFQMYSSVQTNSTMQIHCDDQTSTQACQMMKIDQKALFQSNKIKRQQNTQKTSDIPVHSNNQIDSHVPLLPKHASSEKPLSTINTYKNITNNHTDPQNNSMFSPKKTSNLNKPTEIYPNTSRICISGPAFDLFPEDSYETDTNPFSLNKESDYSFTAESTNTFEEYVPESDNDSFVPEYIPMDQSDLKDNNNLDNYSFFTFSKFNDKAVKNLYQGIPCTICYKRFPDNKEDEFQKHLDFHFKKSQTMHIVRKYAPHYSRWIENSNGKNSCVPLKSRETKRHTLQVFDDFNLNKCGICNDRFDVQFDKKEDCYMLQNAVMFNDNPYHPICINMT